MVKMSPVAPWSTERHVIHALLPARPRVRVGQSPVQGTGARTLVFWILNVTSRRTLEHCAVRVHQQGPEGWRTTIVGILATIGKTLRIEHELK